MADDWIVPKTAAPQKSPAEDWVVPQAPQGKQLVPQPQGPTPPGSPGNPLLIQEQSFTGRTKEAAGKGVERMKEAVTQPGILPTQIPRLLGGLGEIISSPITAAGGKIEEAFPALKKAQQQGQILPLESPADIIGTSLTLGIPSAKIPAVKVPSINPVIKALKVHLSPDTISPESEAAAGAIRSAQGTRFRDTASTAAALEPFHAEVNALPEPQRWNFIDYVERRSEGATRPAGNLGSLADIIRDASQQREQKLAALPSKAKMEFVQDYLAHFWQDPDALGKINASRGGQGKMGSAASLKKRTIPTYAEGIAAGLKPLTSDPIEITMRYVRSMDRYIAAQEVLDAAKANGTVKYFRPSVRGASGHPEPFSHNVEPSGPIPEGWVELQGRGATNETGQTAYAPADWARVYNNFISRGFYDLSPDIGRGMDALQHASNSITALELGASAYHALNVATSAVISDVGRAISNVAGGHPIKGLKAFGRSFTAPVSSYLRGRKLEQVYLGRSQGTPDWRRVIDIATKAGSRGVGKRHASDYEFSSLGSYWTSFKRGALRQEMAQSLQNIKDQPVVGGFKELTRLVGRAMETISKPLFEDYIPRVKNAALYDLIKDWVEANPGASFDEQVAVARRMVGAMDDRFGEMIQDNIFWNKALKQTAQIAMRSYSWSMGIFRQSLRSVGDPRRLSISHPNHNPALAATIAGAIVIPTINAIYQYLKTGKSPESVQDLMAPRTGGTVPGFAGRGQVSERAILPSHERDIFGWWYDPKQEAINKQARFMQMIEEGFSGKDFAGRPYMNPDASTEMQVMQWLGHLAQGLMPISAGTLAQGHKKGSTLGVGAGLSGVREAPKYLEDPTGYKRGLEKIHRGAYQRGQKSIRKQERQYEGSKQDITIAAPTPPQYKGALE